MRTLLLWILFALTVSVNVRTEAALITQAHSQAGGENWTQASDGTNDFWSNGVAPSSGNDYVMGAGMDLRTPVGSNSTFQGDSLRVDSGARLIGKTNNNSRVYTVNNLVLNGGTLFHGEDNRNFNFNGGITVASDSTIFNGGGNARPFCLNSSISGSSNLTVSVGAQDTLLLGSTTSTFSGDWIVGFSTAGNNGDSATFTGVGDGSLGSGSITIGSGVTFDADYDIFNAGSFLTLDGEMILDQDHTFQFVTINGNSLAAGTYSFADFNAAYDANFVDGGSGSLTVLVPEPSTLLPLSILALSVLRRRRRKMV